MHNLRKQHMNAVMLILRYLKFAIGKGILFTENLDHQSINAYIDANWVGVIDDRWCTSDYFPFIDGNLVRWKSKKQNIIIRLSAKIEYRCSPLDFVKHYG